MRAIATLALLSAVCLIGCGTDSTQPAAKDEVAVFGYLYVDETVGNSNAVYVTRTRPIDVVFDPVEATVVGATVLLRKEGGAAPDTLRMIAPGRYANPAVVIAPLTTYNLTIQIAGRPPITATTRTPNRITMLREPRVLPGVMHHASIPDSFPIVFSCPDPQQIFLGDIYCLEDWRDARYIHRFGNADGPNGYKDYGGDNDPPRHIFGWFRAKDLDREGADYRLGWYGDMMAFYGTNAVGLLAIDDNYYNYLYRDHPELHGGLTGAIGVFGSACRKQYRVKVVQ